MHVSGRGINQRFLSMSQPNELAFNARITSPKSGRVMEVWSTEPGIQVYSGNFLEGKIPRDLGKGSTVYPFRSAFCLEPSRFPDSPNHAGFPSTEIKPGEWYSGKIVYKFSTDKAAKK